jgi:hypothetical protein
LSGREIISHRRKESPYVIPISLFFLMRVDKQLLCTEIAKVHGGHHRNTHDLCRQLFDNFDEIPRQKSRIVNDITSTQMNYSFI